MALKIVLNSPEQKMLQSCMLSKQASGFLNSQHHTVQWFTSHFDVYINITAGDTLGGHLDDMEADWSKPIVSLRYYAYIFGISCLLVSRYKHVKWKI